MEEKALECQIAVMLRLIGVQPNVRGWRYIVDGVKLVAADEELAHHMTKELYPAIAAKHDTTTSRVERCIRLAQDGCCCLRSSESSPPFVCGKLCG